LKWKNFYCSKKRANEIKIKKINFRIFISEIKNIGIDGSFHFNNLELKSFDPYEVIILYKDINNFNDFNSFNYINSDILEILEIDISKEISGFNFLIFGIKNSQLFKRDITKFYDWKISIDNMNKKIWKY
jgi:hypothetical protein